MSPLPVSSRRCLWFHADTGPALARLAAFWQAFAPDVPQATLVLSHPADLTPPDLRLVRCTRIALPRAGGVQALADALGPQRPCAGLMVTRLLMPALVRLAVDLSCPLMLADADYPRVAGLWTQVPWLRGRLLRKLDRVFVPSAEYQRTWLQAGLPEDRVIPSGWLGSVPQASAINEAERDAMADALRQRTVWLAAGVPEVEEGIVLAALRETLRDSHRLVLLLHPENPARGPALKADLDARFVTALRSSDDPITPETQVYIVDTEGERGLWYRLAVACYLGGSLSRSGATQSPFDAANLGCAIVHGRETGRHGDAFALLADAQATRRILRADALGRAMCATLRPDAAALLARRAWEVVSDGADAYDAIAKALKAHLRRDHAAP